MKKGKTAPKTTAGRTAPKHVKAHAAEAARTAVKTVELPSAAVGRPRAFDVDTALEKAMRVFWQRGYEGTSLTALTDAMDINRPSLYAAFGNKEALFRKALERYQGQRRDFGEAALAEPVARVAIEKLLLGTAEIQTDPGAPQGCLVIQGALVGSEEAEPIRKELIARRAANQAAIRERLERAKAEGDLPAKAKPAALALYFMTVINGMAVQAASGATREELQELVTTAMGSWPR